MNPKKDTREKIDKSRLTQIRRYPSQFKQRVFRVLLFSSTSLQCVSWATEYDDPNPWYQIHSCSASCSCVETCPFVPAIFFLSLSLLLSSLSSHLSAAKKKVRENKPINRMMIPSTGLNSRQIWLADPYVCPLHVSLMCLWCSLVLWFTHTREETFVQEAFTFRSFFWADTHKQSACDASIFSPWNTRENHKYLILKHTHTAPTRPSRAVAPSDDEGFNLFPTRLQHHQSYSNGNWCHCLCCSITRSDPDGPIRSSTLATEQGVNWATREQQQARGDKQIREEQFFGLKND